MGAKIPRPLRLQVITKWLQGKSRDKIAGEVQISTGAVSGIIGDFRKEDLQFDLQREVAVKLKNLNMTIENFAPLIRVFEVLRDKELLTGVTGQETLELIYDRLEAIVVSLEVFFFKGQFSIEEFVGLVTNMYNTANKFGVPLDKFPSYAVELENRIDVLKKEIDRLETKKQDALMECGEALDLLREYNANKPFIAQLQELKRQIADKEEKLDSCNQELENEKRWYELEREYPFSVSDPELEKVNMQLAIARHENIGEKPILTASDLKEMVMDVFDHPSKYVNVLAQMMDIYKLQDKGAGKSAN